MVPTAIVTGASRGIGSAIAVALAEEGFDIAAVSLPDPQATAELAAKVTSVGRRFQSFDLDIGNVTDQVHVIGTIFGVFGSVECLVNNAGVSVKARGDLLDVSQDSFDRCFDVNTRGTFFFTQAVAKRMASAEPPADVHRSIVFVTSSNAVMASVERGEYCMSKTALSMAVKLFAIRMARHRVGVYEIQPGLIMTEMTKPSKAKYDALIDEGMLIERRWGQPEDVARTVRSMAAGLLPYTAAQEVRVDGGLMLGRF